MEFAAWTYPWDILDEGPKAFAEHVTDFGVSEVNVATNYHSVQAFLPHNPSRRTFFAQASSYFQPDAGVEYGSLVPVPNETMGDRDWIDEIGSVLTDMDLSLTSWTIGSHNSRLGMAHRDATLTNAYGDDLVFGLCPSNPDVQQYLTAIVTDLNQRGYFERIELESFDYFFGSGFGWHHDKFHVELGTLGTFLFGLCFCDHCRERAVSEGIDVDSARRTVTQTVDAIAAGSLPHDTDIAGWMTAHPEVERYVHVRTDTLFELYNELADAAASTDLGCYIGFLGVEDAWMHGYDLERFAEPLDYYTVIAYESSRSAVMDRVRIARSLTDLPIHAGVLPGHPAVSDETTLESIIKGLDKAGVERTAFYNYGLLPSQNLNWIKTATSAVLSNESG
jgi:hypothetical protein